MAKPKCSKTDYKRAKDDQLDSKADAVVQGLTNHAVEFPAPPLSAAALQDLLDVYIDTYTAYKRGGLDQREEFLNAKTDLLNAMDSIADYVDSIAKGNGAIITDGGFVPTKSAPSPMQTPTRPVSVLAKYGNGHGEIVIESPVVEGAEYYGLLMTQGTPAVNYTFINGLLTLETTNTTTFIEVSKSRKKTIKGLNAGVMYYCYMYAGNTAGVSSLSDMVQIMAV
jgi:hypothetical protein